MKRLSILILFVLLAGATTTQAQTPSVADVTKSFNKVKGDYDKFMGKVKPFQDAVNKNMNMLPSDVQSKYKAFNDGLSSFDSMVKGFDPTKITDPAAAATQVDKMKSGLKDLDTQYKSLSSAAKKAGIKM